jgi:hypothetical protein
MIEAFFIGVVVGATVIGIVAAFIMGGLFQ